MTDPSRPRIVPLNRKARQLAAMVLQQVERGVERTRAAKDDRTDPRPGREYTAESGPMNIS